MSRRLVALAYLSGLFAMRGWAQSPATRQHYPVLVLVVRPHGFYPAEETLNAGKTFLAIQNLTGLAALTFHVSQKTATEAVQQMPDLAVRAPKPHTALFLNLTTGVYTLTEASHPKWTCQITVK